MGSVTKQASTRFSIQGRGKTTCSCFEHQYSCSDGRRIEISFDRMDGCELITVSNTGCTLEAKELPQIFESFHRGNNADKVQGNGLGLFICKRLMALMGGEVYADICDERLYITLVVKMA